MKTETYTETSTAVYVGTFAKYNSGSIKGAWIKLEGHDAETFQAACLELHSDESDPELMFQDFEGFPRAFYSESERLALTGKQFGIAPCVLTFASITGSFSTQITKP
jgi:antirestriction protein